MEEYPKNIKPLSKWEAEYMKKSGISKEEYLYEQACKWALLMGEELPRKDEFMKGAK